MRIHLGCGQVHLDGYRNIDFPPSEHTIQGAPLADEYADLRQLAFPPGSVDEVRLHHVFEHFSRPVACALLASWSSWLAIGGTARIEVPDFDRTARRALSRWTSEKKRRVALRHIFGSQEAHWAAHHEGWSGSRLDALGSALSFDLVSLSRNAYRGTFNVEVVLRKAHWLDREEAERAATAFLSQYLVDEDAEAALLSVWLDEYRAQVEASWAR